MTPKEKAEDLFKKMNGFRTSYAHRVKCAKIAVDETIGLIHSNWSKADNFMDRIEYYEQVKTELDKLKLKKNK